MYRSTAAKRLLLCTLRSYNHRLPPPPPSRLPSLPVLLLRRRFSTSSPSNESLNFQIPSVNPSTSAPSSPGSGINESDTVSADSFTESTGPEEEEEEARRGTRTEYKDEQARALHAALGHVNALGWSEAAMMAGAREVGVSPSIVGSFSRKEAELVEYFMEDCLQKLIDIIDSEEDLKNMIPSERISKLVKTRLEMQAPYISRWAQALSIQALPVNIPTSFKQRALLVDEIWHAAGDATSDIDWYVKRTVLGGIYSATEVYMLTDDSPDFRDTWGFLNARVRDAFDFKKSVQEAQNLAEAVGAGMGSSLEGLAKRVSQIIR